MYAEESRGVRGGLATSFHEPDDLQTLLWFQLRRSATDAAFLTSRLDPGKRSLLQHGTLELGEGTDHLHHHAPGRGRGVDRLREATEPGLTLLDSLHEGQHVAQRPGQPIELPDHHHVSLTQVAQEILQFWPVPASAGGLLAVDFLAASGLERRDLRGGILILGRDACVADEHGA